MLNISKRTLQRYRSLGDLPYEMIYHKTFYRESEVLKFIERHFSKFRNIKKTSSV
ncbi:MAG: helix-turn-helix domain-containing protein [Alistipes senegalensis]|nr:helix-turn-helix domain-containing protein [Bacteroides cellulosilyticus]MCM1352804.1 helix-turn-helix domain-containing protein [Alistipes senegalensis]